MKNNIDFFISHAFEDKQDFVKKLADNLLINGANVFYDEYSIKLGDSITESINKGLSISKNAIIVLSKYFFQKGWTNAELQAIFNKKIYKNFKLFIIYHNVTHDQVSKKYPLLADLKSINSSVPIEKITEHLFNSIKKPFSLSYIKDERLEFHNSNKGIAISMFVGFPLRLNPTHPKTLFELGNPNFTHSRLKIFIINFERIYFEITDSNYRKYSLSLDFNNWKSSEMHFIHLSLDFEKKSMSFLFNDEITEKINIPDLIFEKNYLKNLSWIVGCSLNLNDPCNFLLGYQIMGEIDNDPKQIYIALKKHLQSLGQLD